MILLSLLAGCDPCYDSSTSDYHTGSCEAKRAYDRSRPVYVPVPTYTPSYTPSYSSPSYSTPSYSTPSYSTPSYSTPSYSTPSYDNSSSGGWGSSSGSDNSSSGGWGSSGSSTSGSSSDNYDSISVAWSRMAEKVANFFGSETPATEAK